MLLYTFMLEVVANARDLGLVHARNGHVESEAPEVLDATAERRVFSPTHLTSNCRPSRSLSSHGWSVPKQGGKRAADVLVLGLGCAPLVSWRGRAGDSYISYPRASSLFYLAVLCVSVPCRRQSNPIPTRRLQSSSSLRTPMKTVSKLATRVQGYKGSQGTPADVVTSALFSENGLRGRCALFSVHWKRQRC